MSTMRSLILILCLAELPLSAQANCTDIGILADYGIIGENEFDYGNNSLINGNDITGNGNTPTPTGTTQTVDLNFPPIDPPTFPATGGPDLDPPSGPITPGSYGEIESSNNVTFTGGDYYIEKLDIGNSVTLTLGPGNYYIEEAEFGNNLNLVISPAGSVKIYIGQEFNVGNEANLNSSGNTGDLIFYMYDDTEFDFGRGNQGSNEANLNGIIYSPFANSEIDFANNNNITGAILSAGEVDVGKNTEFDYSDSVKADVLEALGCQPVSAPDHYHISHAGSGIICEPSTVSITAHNADHSPFITTSDITLAVSTSPAVDAIIPTNPTILSGDSSTSVQISRSSVTTDPHIDINVTDGTLSETSGSAETDPTSANYDDPKLQFVETLFVFGVFDASTGLSTSIGPQIAGKPTSTPPADSTISLRAIRAGDPTVTPECQAALTPGVHNIEIGYQCINSAACSANELLLSNQFSFNPNGAATLARNAGASFNNTTTVPLSFNAFGLAPVSLRYDNAGRIALFAETLVIAPGNVINRGISNDFVVRPFALPLDFGDSGDGDGDAFDMRQDDWNNGGLDGSNNNISYSDPDPVSNPQNSSVFATSGADFDVEISAILWQQSDDANNDGIADTGANLYDNPVASLFGQESSSPSLIFSHALQSPATGTGGNLQAAFNAAYNGGKTVGSMSWDEVGIIDIGVTLPTYLGDSSYDAATSTGDVGRFRPAAFRITAIDAGTFDNGCGTFTYSGQEFGYQASPSFVTEAINARPTPSVTQNYSGTWSRLDASSFNLSSPVTTNTGSDGAVLDLVHTPAPLNLVDNGDGTFAVSLGAETFCYGLGAPCTKQTNAQVAEFNSAISMTLLSINDGEISTAFSQDFAPSATAVRYGRLTLDNVFGSELTSLQVPMYTEYFDGSNFVVNTSDFCTTIDHSVAGELLVTASPTGLPSTASVSSITAVAGILNIDLTAPGNGNTGFLDLQPDLDISTETWLKYDWDATAASPGLENPKARASFGIYQGNPRQIYYRQIFR